MPCSRSSSSLASVTSSLHCEEHLAGGLVDDVVRGDLADELGRPRPAAGRSSSPASFLIAALVNLRFFLTRISRESGWRMSRVARWPGSSSYSTDFAYFLLALEEDRLGGVEVVEQLLGRVAERAQQHRRVQLAAAVDADVEDVLRVELEVEPRAAVRDHAGAVEQLARRVGLALVVIEEDARASGAAG